jgi:16S rRNA (uracil1498-N3)-methyltransferase
MQLFYHPDIQPFSLLVTFSKDESRHMIRVLRKKRGDQIHMTDGKGNLYLAEIIDDNDKKCEAQILNSEKRPNPRTYRLHVAIAPTKSNDRIEWFLEKSTEIGVDEITPLICDHSERKKINEDRWNKVLLSAMKQSLKYSLPKLNPLQTFEELVSTSSADVKIIAHCAEGDKHNLRELLEHKNDILVLVGPEGDFSPDEIQKALNAGFENLDLGRSRLRTETAGVVICSNVAFMKEFL